MTVEEFNPVELRQFPPEIRRQVADKSGDVIRSVYGNVYPLSAQDGEQFDQDIRLGEAHVFTLLEEDEAHNPNVLALATIIEKENKLGGEVQFAELGRAGKRADYDASVRELLTKRVTWARERLHTRFDFLESTTRSAGVTHSGINSSGKGVQSVWWGGRRYGQNQDLMTTRVGWDYRLGEIEPFTSFAIPMDSERWQQMNKEKTTYVGSKTQADTLLTTFYEHSNGAFFPKIEVVDSCLEVPEPQFCEIQEGGEIVTGKFAVTDRATRPSVSYDVVSKKHSETFSQVVTIEADWATTQKGAILGAYLEENGWTLTGWEPSRLEKGVICPTFGRVNAREIDHFITPTHHPEYFDEAGLGETRKKLDNMYQEMKEKATT